jgi:transcriptional regulator with XRE-family HTH domain
MNLMTTDYGAWLRWAREEAGMSQRKLASIMGVSDATVSRWESGDRHPKHASRLLLTQVLRGSKR